MEAALRHVPVPVAPEGPTLADKVAYLSRPETYGAAEEVTCRETHMSFVFLAGARVYKLKKPVRFPYLDFSTLERREAACRAELALNRRLAADVYENVTPLVQGRTGLSLGGPGAVVDWLVVMRRLDEGETLEMLAQRRQLTLAHLDRLVERLVKFYRHAEPLSVSPEHQLAHWHLDLAYNRRILLDARLGLPAGLVRAIDRAQRRFLARRAGLLEGRARGRHIVDGHGDLRPEHIWPGEPVRIIDCLEFNPRLRGVDPFDEIAFLCVECERLGAAWAGEMIKRRVVVALGDHLAEELLAFYRCYRATLRARLAIAHLLEPEPRTPEKWPRLARSYLAIAAADARRLEEMLRPRPGRRAASPGAAA
jgi:aminoglycoside phosphotransferase family enzyme